MFQQPLLSVRERQQAVPVLAVSAKWFTFPERFHWIAEQGFALEYTPNPEAFSLLAQHLDPFLHDAVRVRHHGFFPEYEIGNVQAEQAEQAMQVHFAALDALLGRGEQVITVHIGVNKSIRLDPARIVENLARLVDYGQQRGIIVSLENLKQGLTSKPETVLKWAEVSGASITLDVGHALSSSVVKNGDMTVHEIIDLFAPRLMEAHVYEKELDRHYAPEDMQILGPVVDRLLETKCAWWTIELDDFEDILRTRRLLGEYMVKTSSHSYTAVEE